MNKLEEILITLDDIDIGYFVDFFLLYPDNIKEKKESFLLSSKKIIHKYKYNEYMKKIKPKMYTKAKKFICVWLIMSYD